MPRRSKAKLVSVLCDLVGPDICRVVDARDGWPGLVDIHLSTGVQRFSVHVGDIHSMARKPHEFRFQNPVKEPRPPVQAFPGTRPLLIGVWQTDEPAVLVATEPEHRMGHTTRVSVLFPDTLFREAQEYGWAEPFKNDNGILHWSFHPPLLPSFIELYQAGASLEVSSIQVAAVSSGLVNERDEPAAIRARQTVTRLVRDATFGKKVVDAYDEKCAMCGINLGLVSGAHILPVSAVNSVDEIWNALALCENHHRAFDRHKLWIEPNHRTVKIHPAVIEYAKQNDRSKLFVESTFQQLSDPLSSKDAPRPAMFIDRCRHYKDEYTWA